jgi:hypothetical protein
MHGTYCSSIDTLYLSATYQNIPVTDFFSDIENRFSLNLHFKYEWFAGDTINICFTNTSLPEALNKAIQDKPYIFRIIQENIIVFMPKEEVALITGQMVDLSDGMEDISIVLIGDPNQAGKFRQVKLTGRISDGKTGEPLIGATLHVENTTLGVVSNLDGRYFLDIKPGIYNLMVSSIGFEKTEYKVKIISDGTLDIELFEKSVSLEEITIYGHRPDENVQRNEMSLIEINAKNIKQLPAITGEKDILKTFTMMPGVKSIGEFGSGINVRGGSEDQNLYLIEGAPIFNTSHVFGLLSLINPDAVNSVTLYKGHIPAGFGERVSSVMDIKLKANDNEKLHGRGGIGLYNSRFMIAAPLFNNIVSFNLGGRSSYSSWLLKKIPDYYLRHSYASFHDINAILKISLKKHQFSLFGYNSYNHFRYASELDYEYENLLGSLKWNHSISTDMASSMTVSYSGYNVDKSNIRNDYEHSKTISSINYLKGKYNISHLGFACHNIDLGLQGIFYRIHPGKKVPLNDSSLVSPEYLKYEQAFEGAFYVNDLYELSDNISLNAGIRYSFYFDAGPLDVLQYSMDAPRRETSVIDTINYRKGEIIEQYSNIEPRLSFKFQFNESNSLKLSYTMNSQYISLISFTSISTPEDVWKLSDLYIKPLKANQFAIGYFRNFMNNSIETSIEAYYKKLENLIEYKNDADIEMRQNIETELINTNGRNYGI